MTAAVVAAVAVTALVVAPSVAGAAGGAATGAAAATAVPVELPLTVLRTGHAVVDIEINGRGPFGFLLDTGSPVTLLDEATALATKALDRARSGPVFGLFGPGVEVRLDIVRLGSSLVRGVDAFVLDHPALRALAALGRPVVGIAGMSLLGRFRMRLDYRSRSLTLSPTGHVPVNVLSVIPRSLAAALSRSRARRVLAPAGAWGMALAKPAGDASPGVRVTHVHPGSAAAAIGLQVGDRLLTLDDRWTDSVDDCFAAAQTVEPGQVVRLLVRRDGRLLTLRGAPRPGL